MKILKQLFLTQHKQPMQKSLLQWLLGMFLGKTERQNIFTTEDNPAQETG